MPQLLQMLPALKRDPDSGAPLRSAQIHNYLSKDLTVTRVGFGRGRPVEDFVPVDYERQFTIRNLIRGALGPTPVSILNYTSTRMREVLTQILSTKHFAAIQFESVHLLPYLPLCKSLSSHSLLVADWHYIDSEFMSRFADHVRNPVTRTYARRTSKLLAASEKRLALNCGLHLVVSEREKYIVESFGANVPVHVIPNGVDCLAYSSSERSTSSTHANGSLPRIVFVGSMDYRPNVDAVVWFCLNVWPTVTQDLPDLRFVIVGRDPRPEVKRLARLPNVEVTGRVDDVRPYYRDAIATVVPLRFGSGTRIKILEAMAASVPVMSTRLGIEGLHAEPNVDFMLADDPREFAAAIRALVQDAHLGPRLAARARTLVQREYDWPVIGTKLRTVYRDALERHSAHRVIIPR